MGHRKTGLPSFHADLCKLLGVQDDTAPEVTPVTMEFEGEAKPHHIKASFTIPQEELVQDSYISEEQYMQEKAAELGVAIAQGFNAQLHAFDQAAGPDQTAITKGYVDEQQKLVVTEFMAVPATKLEGIYSEPIEEFGPLHDLIEKAAELEAEEAKSFGTSKAKCITFGQLYGEDDQVEYSAPDGKAPLNNDTAGPALIDAVGFVDNQVMNWAQACQWFNSQLPEGAPKVWPAQLSDRTGKLLNYASVLGEWLSKKKQELSEYASLDAEIEIGMELAQEEMQEPDGKELVEITLSGLTPEEAAKVLKTYGKQKPGSPVMASTKKMKDIGTGSKAIIRWEFESSSMVANGTPVKYVTQLNEDGTLSCQCRGWTQGSVKAQGGRFCKHTKAIEAQFNVKLLFKKWKKGEPLGDDFAPAEEMTETPAVTVKASSTEAPHTMTFKSKRIVEI